MNSIQVAVRGVDAGRETPSVPPPPQGGGRGDLILVVGVCLVAQVIAGALVARTHGFWSPDSALRFIQVEQLRASGYRDLSVPYPAASLDPEGRYFPLGGWFHFHRDGRFYLSYLPYFSMASAPFFGALGFGGLLLIPAASVLGTVWVSYEVVRARAPDFAWPAAAVVGLATPLSVYGIVFWDHSLAVLLAAGALALIGGTLADAAAPVWKTIAAGALLGLGLWVRNEMYPFAAAVAVAWWFASPRSALRGAGSLALGFAGPAAVLWALNTWLSGSPFGWKGHDLVATRLGSVAHAATGGASGTMTWIADKLANAYYQLASPDFYAFNTRAVVLGLALAAGLLLGVLLLTSAIRRRSGPLALGGVGVWITVSLLVVSGRTMVSGLLPAAPIVLLALLAGARGCWERFLWAVIVLFGAAVIVTGTHGGLQWGPRYLLPVLPPLIWLAAIGAARIRTDAHDLWPTVRLGLTALAAMSVVLQFAGTDQVLQASARNARLNAWLERTPADIVVTPLAWLTVGAGPVYFDKKLLLVQHPEDFRQLVETLSARHVERWAYVPFSGLTFSPMAVAQWTEGDAWRFRPVQDRLYEGLRTVTYVGAASP